MNLNATLIGQLVSFALFVWFCMKFVWPPIIKAIETRQSQIANALASAEAAKKEQADTKLLAEEEISKARIQAQEIIDAANKRRNEVLDEVKTEAEELKAKIIEQGYAEVEAERKRVQGELRLKVASLAIAGAEKIVGRTIDEAANNDIIDKLVAEL
ncbi:F0F1 ATP synthase subunit B [Rodentibacter trehalosifermentans]|uniref:ATP synthase subunit b n=1 Tax=Rodentibacter trehalosifermentans TaxID=1908263 RepID=A0A1V3IY09_9PAST|nr:F0F1 ATP synthase subunit B [Rodentibacter trehalosifermentans]OOF46881.1 F0F1 ATP synthase subunit B [Rodentibacter trehalosifermentans]